MRAAMRPIKKDEEKGNEQEHDKREIKEKEN